MSIKHNHSIGKICVLEARLPELHAQDRMQSHPVQRLYSRPIRERRRCAAEAPLRFGFQLDYTRNQWTSNLRLTRREAQNRPDLNDTASTTGLTANPLEVDNISHRNGCAPSSGKAAQRIQPAGFCYSTSTSTSTHLHVNFYFANYSLLLRCPGFPGLIIILRDWSRVK